MRILALIALLFFCGASLDLEAILQDTASHEQTDFGVEDEFQRPVPLPSGALNALRDSKDKNDLVEECAEREGIKPSEIPQSWFTASSVRLSNQPDSGLVVKGENGCLLGAHITQFWVLAKSSTGEYRIVFRGRGDGMAVLRTRTNGYRDLQLVIVTQAGANVDEVTFRYSKGSYRISSHHVTHN